MEPRGMNIVYLRSFARGSRRRVGGGPYIVCMCVNPCDLCIYMYYILELV